MYVIGLCGRSGSGKSTVCGFLKEKGFYCIDADKVCHKLYETDDNCINELSERFGSSVVKDSKIDRSVLRVVVFESPNGIADLNTITHKYIITSILAEAELAFNQGYKYVVVDAPTLFESGLNAYCNATIGVVAEDNSLLERLKKRDALSKEALEKRLKSQKSNLYLYRNCTQLIKNNGTLQELRQKVFVAVMLILIKLGALKAAKEAKRYVIKKA